MHEGAPEVKRLYWLFGAFLGMGLMTIGTAWAADEKGLLTLKVPADAKVEIDGVEMKATGAIRKFETPALPPGKYPYSIKVNGKEISIEIEVGKELNLDLTGPVTTPKKEEPKKETPKEEMKKELPKKEEPKKEAPKVEMKKEEPKKVEPKKETPKEEMKKDLPKKEEPKTIKKSEDPTIVVPYVPTPQNVVEKMLEMASVKEGETVYDLGCGDGRIVVTAVKKYKAKKGFGIDLNPDRVKDSEETAKKAGVEKSVTFKQGDVLKITDLSEANVITLYLLPEVNKRLIPVIKATCKPGTRIVSHDFDMGDWKADKEIDLKDDAGISHTIYLWTIGGAKKEAPKKEIGEPAPMPKVQMKKPIKPKETIVVPYVATPQKVVDAMLKLAEIQEGDTVYDLGCGDGRIVVSAVKSFKAKKGLGIDLNPERVKDSEETAKKAGVEKSVTFKQGDVLDLTDLSEANVITLYLLPEVNLRLIPVIKATCKPGTRIISHDFDMGDWKADKEVKVKDEDDIDHLIYLWKIPAKK
jgi:uncharacterized protein (TIGR03000 family)